MQRYEGWAEKDKGGAIPNASILITTFPGGVPATIYSANGTGLITSSTVEADRAGNYFFYAANGRYSRTISAPGFDTRTDLDCILLQDFFDGVAIAHDKGITFGISGGAALYAMSTNSSTASGPIDNICEWSYNIQPGGTGNTPIDPAEPRLKIQMESNWYSGGINWMELNFDFLTTEEIGIWVRPMGWHGNRLTGVGDWGWAGTQHAFYKTTLGSLPSFTIDLALAPAATSFAFRWNENSTMATFGPLVAGAVMTTFDVGWGALASPGGLLRTDANSSSLHVTSTDPNAHASFYINDTEILRCTDKIMTVGRAVTGDMPHFVIDLTGGTDSGIVFRYAGGSHELMLFGPDAYGLVITEFSLGWGANTGAGGALKTTATETDLMVGAVKVLQTTGSLVALAVPLKKKSYTVATLPAAGTVGADACAIASDANATTFNSIVAGGGSNRVPVFSDGTNWRIG